MGLAAPFASSSAADLAAGRLPHTLDDAPGDGLDLLVVQRLLARLQGHLDSERLLVGAERAAKKGYAENLDFVEANAEDLPFADGSFDAYTIAFGIRNVPDIDKALREAYRVLKRGGRFVRLEFSEVEMPILDRVYDAWSFNGIPAVGKAIAGEAEPYQYLVESIRKFPRQKDFAAMIERAGFARVGYTNYTGGIAALHSAWKI